MKKMRDTKKRGIKRVKLMDKEQQIKLKISSRNISVSILSILQNFNGMGKLSSNLGEK